jgi:hypothetical protein
MVQILRLMYLGICVVFGLYVFMYAPNPRMTINTKSARPKWSFVKSIPRANFNPGINRLRTRTFLYSMSLIFDDSFLCSSTHCIFEDTFLLIHTLYLLPIPWSWVIIPALLIVSTQLVACWNTQRPVFNNLVCLQGWSLPLGLNLAPRGELCRLEGMFIPSFTPRGEHTLLFIRM